MGRFPFPRNQRLSHLTYPSQADAGDARAAFERWRDEIVTTEGARGGVRTRRPDTPDGQANSTVSEGIAYGMLIAVMFDDQALFDGFWTYARCFLNKSGLMDWYIAPDGARVLAAGAASDADEDMAWALVMADRQWGGGGALGESYLSIARRLIDAIYETEVDQSQWPDMFLPGDDWRGKNVFNPSYFAPNQYRLFGEVSGNESGWQRVIDRGYAILESSLNPISENQENGLVPAWCDADGTPVEAFPGAMQNYQYDSARTPFRLVQDWAVAKDARARAHLGKLSGFFASIGAPNIVDGYELDGRPAPDPKSPPGNPGSAVFVGCAAAGAMHDPRYASFLDAAYARVRTGKLLTRSRYYNQCWTVLSTLMLTGNLSELPPR
ncbi:MAG TPA: glycosyl hydrolase family 8 [Polyangiaceae bacterium]|nr:glycosyl hydrolase family 8 [Polyangiaceae bacterium]